MDLLPFAYSWMPFAYGSVVLFGWTPPTHFVPRPWERLRRIHSAVTRGVHRAHSLRAALPVGRRQHPSPARPHQCRYGREVLRAEGEGLLGVAVLERLAESGQRPGHTRVAVHHDGEAGRG